MLASWHDALAGLDEFIVSDNAMIRTVFDTERGQSRHDDHPRYVLPRGIMKMQVFYNDVVAAKDNRVAAGITGRGIGRLG